MAACSLHSEFQQPLSSYPPEKHNQGPVRLSPKRQQHLMDQLRGKAQELRAIRLEIKRKNRAIQREPISVDEEDVHQRQRRKLPKLAPAPDTQTSFQQQLPVSTYNVPSSTFHVPRHALDIGHTSYALGSHSHMPDDMPVVSQGSSYFSTVADEYSSYRGR